MTEYSDSTPVPFNDPVDAAQVDGLHRLLARYIRQKKYGIDVRETIARIVELSGADKADILAVADKLTVRQDSSDDAISSAVSRIDTAIASAADKDEDLSEVKDARTDKNDTTFSTLKERLDALPIKSDIAYTPLKYGMLQDYNVPGSVQALKSFAAQINQGNSFKLLFLTDIHYGKGTNDEGTFKTYPERDYVDAPPLSIFDLSNMSVFNGIVNAAVLNGDNVHGHEGHDINLRRNNQLVSTARAALLDTDLFITIGNHDSGQVWDKTKGAAITRSELLQIYDYGNNSFGENRKDFAAYKDYADQKIRLISLAGFDNPEIYTDDGITLKYPTGQWSVFQQSQLDFLINSLSTVPNGYTVLITNHAPLQGFFGNTVENASINHELLEGILAAYVAKSTYSGTGTVADVPATVSVDFTDAKGILAGVVTGHQHRDKEVQTIEGVNMVTRTCFLAADRGDSSQNTYTTADTLGTIDQYAFDVIEIDTTNRKVNFNRFGIGSDYQYEY
ncbi:metallophosphoesterase [Liquorilactobacillus nagelii]|uniref:metallophosphoesterase n=1 Tax=Liquorilactobacillus nagelii TaxID=82688 RepID=UPI00070B02C9|nr:metallophosphoesterase [Liquorilactobacillus nagelii]QYH53701.1 hypothetical protein G6O73_02895 [Liquorilactobacillus nagelii DSM 13675]